MSRVEELNDDLQYFPAFLNGSQLMEDKLLDIYELGIPAIWQKRFLLHGFDPLEHMKQDFWSSVRDSKLQKTFLKNTRA
jgi:hypothetical protein